MPDLSASYDIPNPFALFASDFSYDLDGYRAALGFLGDLASGSEHDLALEQNGANPAMLRAWQGGDKFRRVYHKCQAAGVAERAALEANEAERVEPRGQRFIPLEAAPITPRTAFAPSPNPVSWGSA